MFKKLRLELIDLVRRDNEIMWRQINNNREKVNNLYKNDFHNYPRPKVDLLSDNLGEFETNVWNEMRELQKRVEKLEKK